MPSTNGAVKSVTGTMTGIKYPHSLEAAEAIVNSVPANGRTLVVCSLVAVAELTWALLNERGVDVGVVSASTPRDVARMEFSKFYSRGGQAVLIVTKQMAPDFISVRPPDDALGGVDAVIMAPRCDRISTPPSLTKSVMHKMCETLDIRPYQKQYVVFGNPPPSWITMEYPRVLVTNKSIEGSEAPKTDATLYLKVQRCTTGEPSPDGWGPVRTLKSPVVLEVMNTFLNPESTESKSGSLVDKDLDRMQVVSKLSAVLYGVVSNFTEGRTRKQRSEINDVISMLSYAIHYISLSNPDGSPTYHVDVSWQTW